MKFLPVVERELRVAARRGRTYWTRFLAGLSAIALCTWIWFWITSGDPPHERGRALFSCIAGLAFLYSFLAGINTTADALSEEKREGTLGLLFLTHLRGYDVVLGKVVATSVNTAYRLISVFPILAIPLLLGGIAAGEFWRTVLVLTNTLLFSLSAGIAVSAVSRGERAAMLGTLLLVVTVAGGPPLIGLLILLKNQAAGYDTTWLITSAVYPAVLAFDTAYQGHAREFWSATLVTNLLSWLFLGAASCAVTRVWQDRPAGGTPERIRHGWQCLRYGQGSARFDYRQRLLATNPVLWLASRDRLRPFYAFALLGVLALGWLWIYWRAGSILLDASFYFLTAALVHTTFKLWLASEASRAFTEERRTGALELLLSTPLSVGEIIRGELLALQRQFHTPVLIILLLDILMFLAGASDQIMDNFNNWVVLCLGLMLVFVVDLYALGWVGLWLSLTSKRASRAFAGTVARVMLLPWAVYILSLTFMATETRSNFQPSERALLLWGLTLSLVNAAVFTMWAKSRLQERFRVTATQRFESRRQWGAPTIVPTGNHASARLAPG